jgi:hypothetical protein
MGRFFYGIRIVLVNLSWIMINHASWWIPVRQPMHALVRLSGPADNCWNAADVDLNSRRKPLRNFKYESSSSPGNSPGQEEFRPCALSASPYSREPARMADERPPIWVQLTIEYLVIGPFRQKFIWYGWGLMALITEKIIWILFTHLNATNFKDN